MFYDNNKDPIILNVDEDFINWFMKLDDNSLWETVVHNVYNLRVAHIIFLTNQHKLITQMMQSIDNNQKMSLLNKKDNFSNTIVHYLA